jgi:hypothetical protein
MKNDLGLGLAAYKPLNKTMYFKDDSQINSQNLKEELFHAFQDSYYGGTSQYQTTGRVNIEFETKVFKDLMLIACCGAFNIGNAPEDVRQGYTDWILDCEANPSNISDTDYQYWLGLFNQYTPQYSSPLSPNLSSPNALKSINCIN